MARVVVITGGGTGIGAACARLMCAAGDRVFITGRREAPLQAVADETGATALVGDAADGEVWGQRLLPAILDQAGGIDVLICSAGGMGNSPAAETSDSQWREALDSISPARSPAFAPVCPRSLPAEAMSCLSPPSPHSPPGRRPAATSPPNTP